MSTPTVHDLAARCAELGVTGEQIHEILTLYAEVIAVEAPYAENEISLAGVLGLNIIEMIAEAAS